MVRTTAALLIACGIALPVLAQSKKEPIDKFRQLEEILPTPNDFRTASGAPGPRYWQQRADYVINVELDDTARRITGKETITYRNQSPDPLTLRNLGGLVMPVILQIDYADGTSEEMRIPAEIWRFNHSLAKKLILSEKEIRSIVLDPHLETADTDLDNNAWPPRPARSRFQLFKEEKRPNPMQELEKKGPPEP